MSNTYPDNMTRDEAIVALKDGKMIRHTYFSPEEWVMMANGMMIMEDGVTCSPNEFWMWRKSPIFDSGWSIYKMKEFKITKVDVLRVADELNKKLSDEQVEFILEEYPAWQEQDITGTWNLIVEQLIYFVLTKDNST